MMVLLILTYFYSAIAMRYHVMMKKVDNKSTHFIEQKMLLGGISPKQFLKEYWQKKPLLIRNAFSAPVTDLTAEDLAGFACEQDIESRLIRQTGKTNWSLTHGPLAEAAFAQLPEKDWARPAASARRSAAEARRRRTPSDGARRSRRASSG